MLQRRGNRRFHVDATWNTRRVFVVLLTLSKQTRKTYSYDHAIRNNNLLDFLKIVFFTVFFR